MARIWCGVVPARDLIVGKDGPYLPVGKVCVSDRFGQHSQRDEDSAILVPTNCLVLADGAKNISFRAKGRG